MTPIERQILKNQIRIMKCFDKVVHYDEIDETEEFLNQKKKGREEQEKEFTDELMETEEDANNSTGEKHEK